MKKALSLSGSSLKGSALSIEVSKKREGGGNKGNTRGGFTTPRGGFTSPRGGAYQGGSNRGKIQYLDDYIPISRRDGRSLSSVIGDYLSTFWNKTSYLCVNSFYCLIYAVLNP